MHEGEEPVSTTSELGVPVGYHSINAYLIVDDGAAAIAFYEQAFGATVRMRHADENGRIMHAELEIGDSVVMLCGEDPAMNALGPKTLGGSPLHVIMYVPDVDAVFARAVAAGAAPQGEVSDRPYGGPPRHGARPVRTRLVRQHAPRRRRTQRLDEARPRTRAVVKSTA